MKIVVGITGSSGAVYAEFGKHFDRLDSAIAHSLERAGLTRP